MTEITIKKKKERSHILFLNFLRCFIIGFGALFIIFMSTGGGLFTFKHVLIFSAFCIPLSILYVYVVEKFGAGLGTFIGWSSKKVNPREAFSADLARARHSKGAGRFEEALIIINEVLNKDPDFPDALYLKATILWEGFRKNQQSTTCLKKVMGLVEDHETLHQWALNYYHDMKKTK
jgi:hypothetical protein